MSKRKRKNVAIDHGLAEYKHETVKPVVRAVPRTVEIGDDVARYPRALGMNNTEEPHLYRGTVVYIHPLGRFHTVEFRFPHGAAIRESFLGVER